MNPTQEGIDPKEPARLGERVAEKLGRWRPCFEIHDAVEEFLLVQLVTESLRLEHCHELEDERRAEIRVRARTCWDSDRMATALEVVQKLPRNPERWRRELLRTVQGCRWMIGQWEGLRSALETGAGWNDRQRARALDLLGVAPIFREGKTPIDLPADDLVARVDRELADLRMVEEALQPLDDAFRDQAERGLTLDLSRAGQALWRHEAGCKRRFYQLFGKLKRTPVAKSSGSAPKVAAPVPPPAPVSAPIRPNPIETERLSVSAANPERPSTRVAQGPEPAGNRRERRRAKALARSRRR